MFGLSGRQFALRRARRVALKAARAKTPRLAAGAINNPGLSVE